MKDYEVLHIPNGRMPIIGLLHLTVWENRVGLYMPVLDALGRPDGIIIHRGINGNEGKLVIKAAEYDPDNPDDGVVPIDYERKKIDFYSKDFVEACKEMIRKYGGGEFSRGIFYTVKGARDGDDAITFDFRIVASRVVLIPRLATPQLACSGMGTPFALDWPMLYDFVRLPVDLHAAPLVARLTACWLAALGPQAFRGWLVQTFARRRL